MTTGGRAVVTRQVAAIGVFTASKGLGQHISRAISRQRAAVKKHTTLHSGAARTPSHPLVRTNAEFEAVVVNVRRHGRDAVRKGLRVSHQNAIGVP